MISKVDLFYDLIDQAAMIFFEELKIDFLTALSKVSKALCDHEFDSKLSDESVNELEKIFKKIEKESLNNEEIRLALELLIIKAFKHINYRLNLMTPDTVGYLISNIVSKKFKDEITIIDTALGTANLLQLISNHYQNEANLIGIEDDLKLVELAKASANFQNNEITIYYQDALKEIYDIADLVIGDLDTYSVEETIVKSTLYESGVRYFPYLVMESRLKNLKEDGYFIYVIENDFFTQEKSNIFKHYMQDKATLMGLIVLPFSMFKEGYIGKSILIGKKKVLHNYDMLILEIPSLEEESLKRSIEKLNKMIDKI